jgi:hypothetical protein
MQKLAVSDIADLRAYERERDEFRREIIAMKKRRRVSVGALLTLVFENTATMRFQVQEMARVERILADDAIAHEVQTYNELIPDEGELSATMFIEITDPDALREWLPKLVGIEDHVSVVVGDVRSPAVEQDAERLTRADTTSSVHYLKFAFTDAQRAAFAAGPVAIVVDHPEYAAEVVLDAAQRAELATDFSS